MIRAITHPSPDLQLAKEQVWVAGDIFIEDFQRPIEDLGVENKDDKLKSELTVTDTRTSNAILENIGRATGEKSITEERKTTPEHLRHLLAEYFEDNVWCLDPLDGTNNYVKALLANPHLDPRLPRRLSLATVSLAKLMRGQPRVGALLTPLVEGLPRLYAGEEGAGAYLQVGDEQTVLQADPDENEGIIFTSENDYAHIHELARHKGIVTIGLGGMAFKMLAVSDPRLIHTYKSRMKPEIARLFDRLPILGAVSLSASLHDFAASTVVNRESGLVVSSIFGDEDVPMGPGEHGIIVARPRVHGIMVDAVRADRRR